MDEGDDPKALMVQKALVPPLGLRVRKSGEKLFATVDILSRINCHFHRSLFKYRFFES